MIRMKREEKENFITLQVRRVEEGLEFYIKSPKIEEFFGSEDPKNVEVSKGVWMKAYPSAVKTIVVGDLSAYFCYLHEYELFVNGKVDLSILRIAGIGEGKKFTLPIHASANTIQRWLKSAEKVLGEFYRQYIQPVEFELTLTYDEMRGEVEK